MAGDLQRAAAVEQLVQVGRAVGVPVVTPEPGEKVEALAERALKVARDRGHDVVVFDTAGRLHVDEALMAEVKRLAARLKPSETLFVAAPYPRTREELGASRRAPLPGPCSPVDVTRAGRRAVEPHVAKVPIASPSPREDRRPRAVLPRHGGRILGMACLSFSSEWSGRHRRSQRLASACHRSSRSCLRDQCARFAWSALAVLEMLPKVGPLRGLDATQVDDGRLKRMQAILDSMTPLERRRPQVLDGSRKKRIAGGSGTHVQEINQLLKQYQQMQKMLKGGQGKMLRRLLRQSGA